MNVKIKERSERKLTMELEIDLEGSMLNMEENIERALNSAGMIATAEALKKFDTDGSPINIANRKLTSKGSVKKTTKLRMDK